MNVVLIESLHPSAAENSKTASIRRRNQTPDLKPSAPLTVGVRPGVSPAAEGDLAAAGMAELVEGRVKPGALMCGAPTTR
jgi:hypothetical protein